MECINKSCYVIENTLNIYNINKLFLVTSCFSLSGLIRIVLVLHTVCGARSLAKRFENVRCKIKELNALLFFVHCE